MSTRTHAPECAKTSWANDAHRTGSPDGAPPECTCSAEYQPSVEERLAQAERERDEARTLFEESCAYEVKRNNEDPEEFCPPWMKLDLWMTLCGEVSEVDDG